MGYRLIKNAAECRHCQAVLVSEHRHDYKVHHCPVVPITKMYDHDSNTYIDAVGWLFAIDGGLDYAKRSGDFSAIIDRCEYEPTEDDPPVYKM